MSALTVDGLHKAFPGAPTPHEVLRGVDLEVPAGSLAAVLGPSGCGKTTLLRVVAGFEAADAGTITLGGRVVARTGLHVPPEQRRVGVVPQEGALFPHLDVAGNVGFGLARRQRRSSRRIDEVLELVGLAGYARRMPHELSGGQQQRVALARALAPEPSLILLDEPFSALDTGLRASVRADVRTALHAAGATAVLVTHDQEEALSMADLVAVMAGGRIAQADTPGRLYSDPADLAVATFVGEAVVLDADVDAATATARSALGVHVLRARPASSGHGRVVIRPEQITLARPGSGGGVLGRVTGTTFFGHDALIRVALSGESADVQPRPADVAGLQAANGGEPAPSESAVGEPAVDGSDFDRSAVDLSRVEVSARCQGSPVEIAVGDPVSLAVSGPVVFYASS